MSLLKTLQEMTERVVAEAMQMESNYQKTITDREMEIQELRHEMERLEASNDSFRAQISALRTRCEELIHLNDGLQKQVENFQLEKQNQRKSHFWHW